jgi:hypothetical protein
MNVDEAKAMLVELDDILRNRPPRETIRHEMDENFVWLGRVAAAITLWKPHKSIQVEGYISDIQQTLAAGASRGYANVLIILNQARADLLMQLEPQTNVSIDQGQVFAYFDQIRKKIEIATSDIFIIDPYLDAEFVSRYLTYAHNSVKIRLLTTHKITNLLPAISLFAQERAGNVEVRFRDNLHDRFVIIDRANCYQSGASFKDGGKNAPTTIVEISDAFNGVRGIYEDLWTNGGVKFPVSP